MGGIQTLALAMGEEMTDLDSSDPIHAVFPSMATAAAGLFMPLTLIKWAKKQGCNAFDSGNRVRTRKLMAWLHKRDEEEGDVNWLDRKTEFQAKREELRLQKDKLMLVEKDGVRFQINRGMSAMASLMDRSFKLEAPPALKGLDESAIAAWLENKVLEFYAAFAVELEKIGKETE